MPTTPLLWLALCCEEWGVPRPLAERSWQRSWPAAGRSRPPCASGCWCSRWSIRRTFASATPRTTSCTCSKPWSASGACIATRRPHWKTFCSPPSRPQVPGGCRKEEAMAREVITTHTTKLYDQSGRHVGDLLDEYFVDRRDGTLRPPRRRNHPGQAPHPCGQADRSLHRRRHCLNTTRVRRWAASSPSASAARSQPHHPHSAPLRPACASVAAACCVAVACPSQAASMPLWPCNAPRANAPRTPRTPCKRFNLD